tara:strand:- start:707 stop:1135 length:429 start_codon:yes stop_codon:yes gene_type:complete
MKQGLQLRTSQNLALTPQLQQSIRLLQLSTLELNQELEIILQENPLLELIEEDEDSEASNAESSNTETSNDEASDNNASTKDAEVSEQESAAEAPIADDDFKQNHFDEDYEEHGSAVIGMKAENRTIITVMTMIVSRGKKRP